MGIVSSDKYYGLDYILGLVFHKIEGFLNLIEAVESVTDQMGGVESAGLDYGHQALQTKSAAHLEATNKGNVVYKGTSIRNREGYGLVKLIAGKIGDGAAALDHLVGFGQIVLIATCENYLVYLLATGELKHLLGNRSIFVVDDIGCTIDLCKLLALFSVANGDYTACTAQRSCSHCHKTNRANAQNDNGFTELDVCSFCAGKTSSDHVTDQSGSLKADTLGYLRQVHICIGDYKILSEETIDFRGQISAAQEAAHVLIVSFLNV